MEKSEPERVAKSKNKVNPWPTDRSDFTKPLFMTEIKLNRRKTLSNKLVIVHGAAFKFINNGYTLMKNTPAKQLIKIKIQVSNPRTKDIRELQLKFTTFTTILMQLVSSVQSVQVEKV
jgi:hypothetical protein